MTRYDPHPQAHDDARTFGPADAQRRPHDGMPHRGSCGDCGALLIVPDVVGTTLSGFTDRRESDETGPGVPEEGGGLREAVEAALGPVEGHEPGPLVKGPMTETGWLHSECECGEFATPCPHALREQVERVRAVLAACPADAPAEAPEPSGGGVERLAPWLREYKMGATYAVDRPWDDQDEADREKWRNDARWVARYFMPAGLDADLADELPTLRLRVRKAEAERERARTLDLQARARKAEEEVARLSEALRRVTRALDDEEANLADDGARLSHAVVRRLRAALSDEGQTSDATPSDGGE